MHLANFLQGMSSSVESMAAYAEAGARLAQVTIPTLDPGRCVRPQYHGDGGRRSDVRAVPAAVAERQRRAVRAVQGDLRVSGERARRRAVVGQCVEVAVLAGHRRQLRAVSQSQCRSPEGESPSHTTIVGRDHMPEASRPPSGAVISSHPG